MDTPRKFKGANIVSTVSYLDKYCTKEQRDQILAKFSPELRELLPKVNRVDWYPFEYCLEIVYGIASVHEKFEDQEAAILQLGRHMGEVASTTFLRLLMKILTMRMMAPKWQNFWEQYFNFGSMRAQMVSDHHLIVRVEPAFPWAYKIGQGWVEVICESMSLKNVKMVCDLPRGQIEGAEYRLDVTWE